MSKPQDKRTGAMHACQYVIDDFFAVFLCGCSAHGHIFGVGTGESDVRLLPAARALRSQTQGTTYRLAHFLQKLGAI
jgi:hypothetical protein